MNYNKELDYSSLSCYLECPRKFLFQYIMHLRSPRPNIDLIFGSCWHLGLERAFKHLQAGESLSVEAATELAMDAFYALWDEEAAPHFDADITYPKAPGRAHQMYYEYWTRFLPEFLEKKIIGVEVPFSIDLTTLSANLPNYIGRLDLVVEDAKGFVDITDHKTAKSVNKVTDVGFATSLQTAGYLTVGNVYFDALPKITYSIALCQKTKIDFHVYSYTLQKRAIDRFLDEIAMYAHQIMLHLELYKTELDMTFDKNYIPRCFPRQPGIACTSYFRSCEYAEICLVRNNPLGWVNKPPQGFTIDEWNPADHDRKTNEVLATLN